MVQIERSKRLNISEFNSLFNSDNVCNVMLLIKYENGQKRRKNGQIQGIFNPRYLPMPGDAGAQTFINSRCIPHLSFAIGLVTCKHFHN